MRLTCRLCRRGFTPRESTPRSAFCWACRNKAAVAGSPAPHSEAHHAAFLLEPARLARIEAYARRAAEGLPLFE